MITCLHSIHYYVRTTMAKLISCDREHWAHQCRKYTLSGSFQKSANLYFRRYKQMTSILTGIYVSHCPNAKDTMMKKKGPRLDGAYTPISSGRGGKENKKI